MFSSRCESILHRFEDIATSCSSFQGFSPSSRFGGNYDNGWAVAAMYPWWLISKLLFFDGQHMQILYDSMNSMSYVHPTINKGFLTQWVNINPGPRRDENDRGP